MPASITVLDREMFSEGEAARLLRLAPSTLHWWLEGLTRGRRHYRPVIRPEPTGRRSVTWAEFVEAAFLAQYRRALNVPLRELRITVDTLREEFNTPYPLAHFRPWVGEGRQLVLRAQESAGLDADFCLVAVASGQLVLGDAASNFFDRVEWDGDIAVGWKPHAEPHSPVRMKPTVRFGLPSIRGIRTEVIWEHVEDADESVDEVADQFDLSVDEVRWALAYETSLRAA